MEKKKTIDDIAQELSVSKTTVSRAISGKGRIGSQTRERILAYIKENDYRPSAIAKGLAQQKTFNIGFVMPGDCNIVELPFFQKCLLGVSEMASTLDYDVLIAVVSEHHIGQLERMVNNHKIDGVILSRTLVEDAVVDYLCRKGIPFATVGTAREKNMLQIDHDHRSACRELTTILLTGGVRKMALIGGDKSHVVTGKRLQGYREAYLEQGIAMDNSLVFMDVVSGIMVEEIVEKLIQRNTECIVCMDDFICMQVLNVLRKKKIRIPADIKVASFYNSFLLERNLPAVTSIIFNEHELGSVACKMLVDHIGGKEVQYRTLLGYELSMRESTQNII